MELSTTLTEAHKDTDQLELTGSWVSARGSLVAEPSEGHTVADQKEAMKSWFAVSCNIPGQVLVC